VTPDEYLIAAWLRGAPGADTSRGFPRGFWPDVARAAVEMAIANRLDVPLSFRQTMCTRGDWPEITVKRTAVKGLDVSKLEFNL
jgi:hypothetical protein